MMSSAIPARLQFQCGHAALVTLPRIKGETAAQRNARVAREKSAALSRQCDFCAPVVAVATNGNSHSVETPAYTPEPEVILAVAEPQATEAARLEEVNELPLEVVLEVTEPAETTVAETLEALQPALRAEPTDGAAEAAAPMRTPRRRTAQPARKPRAEEVARGRRFLVEYRVERVLHAVDIHDALRQAANFGAGQLTAITRED